MSTFMATYASTQFVCMIQHPDSSCTKAAVEIYKLMKSWTSRNAYHLRVLIHLNREDSLMQACKILPMK